MLRDSRGPQSIDWGPPDPGVQPAFTNFLRSCLWLGDSLQRSPVGEEALWQKLRESSKETRDSEWFRFPSHFSVLFLCPNAYSSLLCLQLCIRSCHAVDKSLLLHSCIHGQAFSSCDCAHSSFNKWKGSKSEWKSTWMLTAVQAKGIWCLQAWFPESAAADWTNSQESKHGLCQSAFSSHYYFIFFLKKHIFWRRINLGLHSSCFYNTKKKQCSVFIFFFFF